MKANQITSKIVTLMALAALTGACDAETEPDAPEQAGGIVAAAEDEVREIRAEADADAILDEIVLAEGASVRFVDEQVSIEDGGVGMLARGMPRFADAVRALELTPLELYLALAPEKEAPARLWEDHDQAVELQGRESRAPRAFRLEQGALAPAGDTFAARAPEPLFTMWNGTLHITVTCYQWSQDFCPDIAANQGGYDWCDSGQATSSVAYAYTGAAGQRWLGGTTCSERWDFEVQVEGIPGAWSFVSGTDISQTANDWVTYTSSTITANNYRSKVQLTSASPYSYYLTAARD